MFDINYNDETRIITMQGTFEASQAEECQDVFDQVKDSVTVDMSNLEFICSAGIGILVMTYNRLNEIGEKIHLKNLNDHIKKVFELSLLDTIFEIK